MGKNISLDNEVKMFLFSRWLATCYEGRLNIEEGAWYREQLEHFDKVVYPNYLANGSEHETKMFLAKVTGSTGVHSVTGKNGISGISGPGGYINTKMNYDEDEFTMEICFRKIPWEEFKKIKKQFEKLFIKTVKDE